MKKLVTFGPRDDELVKQINAYQKKKNLPSFIAAIRELCDIALNFEMTVRKLK